MKITDALLGEHGLFYAQFDHLEAVVPRLTDVKTVVTAAKLLASGLATHAAIEDELLFEALEPHLGRGMGPLAVMRTEHDQIEGGLEQLQTAVDALKEAQNLLLETLQIARQHFAKEEQVLFPTAMQVLGDGTLTALGSQWAQRRKVTVADG